MRSAFIKSGLEVAIIILSVVLIVIVTMLISSSYLPSEAIAILAGAIIGAIASAGGTYLFNRRHALEQEQLQRVNLARSLCFELKALEEGFRNSIGDNFEEAIKNAGRELPGIIETKESVFSIFDNASLQLGLLNSEVAHKVIRTYLSFKSFFTELRYYTIKREEFFQEQPPGVNFRLANQRYSQQILGKYMSLVSLLKETIPLLEKAGK